MDNQPVLTNKNVIVLKVQVTEQSGSTRPAKLVKTVKDLGVTLPDGEAHVPTLEEAKEAIQKDKDAGGGNTNAMALFARYAAMNADAGNPIVVLRRALTDLLKAGALLDSKIDGSQYVWQGDEHGLSAQWRTDDANGSETGVPGMQYLNFSGAAVWGSWQDEFNKIMNELGANDDAPELDLDDDDPDDEEDDTADPDDQLDLEPGNDAGILTIKVPLGVRVIRIEIEG